MWLWAAVLLAAGALYLGLAEWVPMTCPLRRFTGIPCATCGMTRAAVALCHGEFAQATAFNIASVPLAAMLAAVMGLLVWEAVTGRAVVRPLWQWCSGALTWLLVALMLVAWAVNLWRHFR